MSDGEKTRHVDVPLELVAAAQAATEDRSLGDIPPGTLIGSYATDALISSGGGGTVYRARHVETGQPAAVKVLRSELAGSSPMLRRFFLEAFAVNTIKHPNIVDLLEFGELADGRPYLVMEHLDGQDLRARLDEQGPLGPAEALAILEPVCAALDAAHAAGFVHRDVKASNVHVGRRGDRQPAVKLLDFGVVKAVRRQDDRSGITRAGSRIGTSASIAPEQILGGAITPQTDVYALGVLLYRLVVGRNPYHHEDPRVLDEMHLGAPLPRPSAARNLPRALDDVVLRAMQKRPADRHPSAGAFLAALRHAVAAPPAESAGRADAERGRPACRRSGRIDRLPRMERVAALHVEVRPERGAADDDERLFGALIACLDLAEGVLVDAGYTFALQTGSALLGVRALPTSAEAERRARAEALALARALRDRLEVGSANLRVAVSLHATEASLRPTEHGLEVEGGPLLALDWISLDGSHELFVTEAAAAGLAPAPSARPLVRTSER